jgi:hypothetical protein
MRARPNMSPVIPIAAGIFGQNGALGKRSMGYMKEGAGGFP